MRGSEEIVCPREILVLTRSGMLIARDRYAAGSKLVSRAPGIRIEQTGRQHTARCSEDTPSVHSFGNASESARSRDVLVKVRDALASDRVVDARRPTGAGTHTRVEVVDRGLQRACQISR